MADERQTPLTIPPELTEETTNETTLSDQTLTDENTPELTSTNQTNSITSNKNSEIWLKKDEKLNLSPYYRHYQLRDTLQCVENELYYLSYLPGKTQTLNKYNLLTKKEETILKVGSRIPCVDYPWVLSWFILSFKLFRNLLFLGGERSEILVIDLAAKKIVLHDFLDAGMTNAFNFHVSKSETRVLISTNRGEVGMVVYKLPEMRKIRKFTIPSQNGTALSMCAFDPDYKHMIVVGDLQKLYFFDIVEEDYVLKKEIATSDHCHSVDFSRCGKKFAVADPDGLVAVYNVECELLAQFRSSRIEILKFSPKAPGIPNLLAWTEVKGILHVVDVETLTRIQTVDMCSGTLVTGGLCFSTDGKKLFVGIADKEVFMRDSSGFILSFEVRGLYSLQDICIRFIKENLERFKDVDWRTCLPSHLVDKIVLLSDERLEA